MTASAKRVRTAVGRNRIRRLIRESFRHVERHIAGLDVVVLVKDAAAKATNAEITTSIGAHWSRLQKAAGNA